MSYLFRNDFAKYVWHVLSKKKWNWKIASIPPKNANTIWWHFHASTNAQDRTSIRPLRSISSRMKWKKHSSNCAHKNSRWISSIWSHVVEFIIRRMHKYVFYTWFHFINFLTLIWIDCVNGNVFVRGRRRRVPMPGSLILSCDFLHDWPMLQYFYRLPCTRLLGWERYESRQPSFSIQVMAHFLALICSRSVNRNKNYRID